MDKESSLGPTIIKELIGNFSPTYFSALLLLFLYGAPPQFSIILSALFLSTLISFGLSAIQTTILEKIIRIPRISDRITSIYFMEKLYEEKNISNKSSSEIDWKLMSIRKSSEYIKILRFCILFIQSQYNDFTLRKEELPFSEKKSIYNHEGRLLNFFYLTIVFAAIALILIYQMTTSKIIFDTTADLQYPFVLFVTIMFFILLIGYNSELRMYRTLVIRNIPILKAISLETEPFYYTKIYEDKIIYLDKRRDDGSIDNVTHKYLKNIVDEQKREIDTTLFNKNWFFKNVERKYDIEPNRFEMAFQQSIVESQSNKHFKEKTAMILTISIFTIFFISIFYYSFYNNEILFLSSMILSFIVTIIITPKMIQKLRESGFVSIDAYKLGHPHVPTLGGIIVLLGYFSGLLLIFPAISFKLIIMYSIIYFFAISLLAIISIFIGSDKQIFIIHFIISSIFIPKIYFYKNNIFVLSDLNLFDILYIVFLILLLLIISNSYKILPKYNGLYSGVSILVIFSLIVSTAILGLEDHFSLLLPLFGSLLAFFIYNKCPAKIFGDDILYIFVFSIIGWIIAIIIIEFPFFILFGFILFFLFIIEFLSLYKTGFKRIEQFTRLSDQGYIEPFNTFNSFINSILSRHRLNEKNLVLYLLFIQFILSVVTSVSLLLLSVFSNII